MRIETRLTVGLFLLLVSGSTSVLAQGTWSPTGSMPSLHTSSQTATLLKNAPHLEVATQRALAIVVVAGGFVAVIGGALRRAGTARRMVWLAGGMAIGVLGLGLR